MKIEFVFRSIALRKCQIQHQSDSPQINYILKNLNHMSFEAFANVRTLTLQSDKRGHRKCKPLVDGVQFHSLIGIVSSLNFRHGHIQNMLESHGERKFSTITLKLLTY